MVQHLEFEALTILNSEEGRNSDRTASALAAARALADALADAIEVRGEAGDRPS
ncbi:hypothetical protein BjapCC829_48950 (plasmid) [Bradyrhizobium barranii]|uniref:Uncharacterized protein n=1 Tax=Bradyrhizobium barranii TaxID=2992140 RepID=A0ABY3R0Y2_9BRAD|nr:hypothetical protein [Bradyrhizobium japonicum]UFW91937.1 hypothetical protein BjapCC829_48950 [Bradyrhizobium japonicum]